MSIVDNAVRLAISKEMASEGFDCIVIVSTITSVPEVLLEKAEGLDVKRICTAFTSYVWDVHSFPQFVCGLDADGFVLLDVTACACNLRRDVA